MSVRAEYIDGVFKPLDLVTDAVPGKLYEHGLRLGETDFLEGRLPRPSMVRAAKIFTIHSALILRKIGALKRSKLEEVLIEVRRFFS